LIQPPSRGLSGLVVRSRFRTGELQARNPIPLKIRCYVDLVHAKSDVVGQTQSRWCGAEA
ncbi:hypothetical protein AVEN_19192-1, partial [Araneus ventricosus]